MLVAARRISALNLSAQLSPISQFSTYILDSSNAHIFNPNSRSTINSTQADPHQPSLRQATISQLASLVNSSHNLHSQPFYSQSVTCRLHLQSRSRIFPHLCMPLPPPSPGPPQPQLGNYNTLPGTLRPFHPRPPVQSLHGSGGWVGWPGVGRLEEGKAGREESHQKAPAVFS